MYQWLYIIGLKILSQPKNVLCKPGEKLGFSIETSKPAQAYQWYWNGNEISSEDKDYEGSTTKCIFISKCLPKHKGSYRCLVTTELDILISSETATLEIGTISFSHTCIFHELLNILNYLTYTHNNIMCSFLDMHQLEKG